MHLEGRLQQGKADFYLKVSGDLGWTGGVVEVPTVKAGSSELSSHSTVAPRYLKGIGSDPLGYQNPQMLKSLIENGVVFAYNLCTSPHIL